jgi:hypothetical protein
METSSKGAIKRILNTARPSSPTASSPYEDLKKIDGQAVAATTVNSLADMTKRQGGFLVTKTNTCNGNGAQADNLFTVTGTVKVLEIYGVCTEATNATTLSDNSLNLNDGTLDVEITDANAPTDLSGILVGGTLISEGLNPSNPIKFFDNTTTAIWRDAGWEGIQTSMFFIKKATATTYIQHLFTGDADTDVDIKWYIQYIPVSDDGAIASV